MGACRGLTCEMRFKLVSLTAVSGSLENLEVALGSAGLLLMAELLETAAGAGQLEACKLLRERGCPWGFALAAAARGGHRHVCEWLLASGCPLTRGAVYASARGGHEDLMLWLLQLLRENNGAANMAPAELLKAAAWGLDLATFQRLHQLQLRAGQLRQHTGGDERLQPLTVFDDYRQGSVLAAAAGSPSPDWQAKVEWLEGLGYPRTATACSNAASRGPWGDAVGRLRWLHARGYPQSVNVAHMAAKAGDLAALRFLVEQAGVQLDFIVRINAARHSHLAVLQYLHGRGQRLVATEVASFAAKAGNLPVVAWAVEALGATPDDAKDLLDSAAASGSVELMAWLLERGWVWRFKSILNAAGSGCEEALEWLVERGCPFPVTGRPNNRGRFFPYLAAARHGDLAMIRCLHRLGCPWGPDHRLMATGMRVRPPVPVPALRCLVELGCPVDSSAVNRAAEVMAPGDYRTALLEWMGEQQLPPPPPQVQRRRRRGLA